MADTIKKNWKEILKDGAKDVLQTVLAVGVPIVLADPHLLATPSILAVTLGMAILKSIHARMTQSPVPPAEK